MLHLAADFLTRELNAWLVARTGGPFGSALLTRIVTDTGRWAIPDDQIGVALVNVEEERALRSQVPQTQFADGRHVVVEPEIKLNMHLLFAAQFRQYDQGLRQLSLVLTFFQAHPAFTSERNPGLDPRIERLTAELVTLTYEQLNQLWAAIGGKQIPSVVYRFRLVAIQDTEPADVRPPVTVVSVELHRS